MPKYKNDEANVGYDAGDYFNYLVWDANTELTLCNVPWDSVYKDVWQPDSTAELNEWIDERGDSTTILNASYARADEPINIQMPFGRAQRYNYIRVYNPAQPVAGDTPKYYYYFIRGVRHINPSVTEIVVQMDVWQTYIRSVQLGRAFIEQGHIGIANKYSARNFGRDYLTVKDGLDTGTSLVTVAQKRKDIMKTYRNKREPSFCVMAISTVDLTGDHGTADKPLTPSAKPTFIQNIPSGAGAYFWENANDFVSFMRAYSRKPWVTAGITSLTLVPDIKLFPGATWGSEKNPDTKARMYYPMIKRTSKLWENWRNDPNVVNYLPQRYRHLKKFFTSPYCLIQLTFSAGSSIIIRPEEWSTDNAEIQEMVSVMPPNQRYAVVPLPINARSGAINLNYGEGMDMALFLSNFPTIPIVNNGGIMALASNARSRAAEYSGIDWANQKTVAGNAMSFDQATANIEAGIAQANNSMAGDSTQTALANQAAANQAMFNLVGGVFQGAGQGAFAGPAGALAGGVGGLGSGVMGVLSQGMQADAANASLAARMATGGASRDISSGLGTYMRDSNKGLADWAAKGDYANARASMDARVQDTNAIGHGMSGQFGGEVFNLVTDQMALTMRIKMPDMQTITTVGEYWLRYGYPVHRQALIPNNLKVMDKFSYWKLSEIYIRNAAMPEMFKATIRGILEKGVTVWSNPDDMGVIDFADNHPLGGIVIEGYEPPPWTPEPDPEPEPKKKRKTKMLVYSTENAGTTIYALAGSSPGTTANFIKTETISLKDSWLEACNVDNPVVVDSSMFFELESKYLEPLVTVVSTEGP